MKYKTKLLVERFAGVLSSWEGVECITLNEAALPDTLDPYFALILDVFCSAPLPGADERCRAYGEDVAAFESSGQNEKDRFLIGDIPVRLEYKKTAKVDELINIACDDHESLWLIKDSGTYGFYRLANCEVIYSRTNWIHNVRERLTTMEINFGRRCATAFSQRWSIFCRIWEPPVFRKTSFTI